MLEGTFGNHLGQCFKLRIRQTTADLKGITRHFTKPLGEINLPSSWYSLASEKARKCVGQYYTKQTLKGRSHLYLVGNGNHCGSWTFFWKFHWAKSHQSSPVSCQTLTPAHPVISFWPSQVTVVAPLCKPSLDSAACKPRSRALPWYHTAS